MLPLVAFFIAALFVGSFFVKNCVQWNKNHKKSVFVAFLLVFVKKGSYVCVRFCCID